MLFFPFQKNKTFIFGQKYQNYSLTDSITFFKFMMMTLCVNSFIAMIIQIIQQENSQTTIAILAALTIVDFLLFFQTQRLKPYIQNILATLYIFYVASAIIVMISHAIGPQYLSGYGSGIVFCSIIQFCNPKIKFLFVLVTPWVFLAFNNVFILPYLNYIAYTLSASSLLGLMTYQFQVKQECIYSQSIIIKNQQEIIKQFSSDNLFAISLDDRDSQFKLEFANESFENLYADDFKQALRIFQVVSDQSTTHQKRNDKPETLEEYLFQYYKDVQNCEENSYLKLKIRHLQQEKQQDITVLRTYLNQPIFVISIKSAQANSQIEKYENKIMKLKDKIISISSDTGLFLQSQYHYSGQLIKSECQNKQYICQVYQSNILRMLNQMKNYLLYFQSYKFKILQASIKNYSLQKFQQAILSYFEIQSRLKTRYFQNTSQISLNDDSLLKNSQSLLTQILLNIFNAILTLSQIESTIKFSVSNENSQCGEFKSTQRTYTYHKFQNSEESSQITTLQFKFTFTSDQEIQNLERLLCTNKHSQTDDTEYVIISSVNELILRTIGPYNEISIKTYQNTDFDNYFNEVIFFVYPDQTQLEDSFIKQNQVEREI